MIMSKSVVSTTILSQQNRPGSAFFQDFAFRSFSFDMSSLARVSNRSTHETTCRIGVRVQER